jgi:hypothetical protein
MGYDDLLLFDVEKIITKLEFADSESGRPAQFTWLSRKICQEELGRITTDKFVDFSSGHRSFQPFPLLNNEATSLSAFKMPLEH